ncbi:hypothetical protein KGY73_03515 [bacterium]|nr:hypothetical protein [bacterium]
MINKIKNFFIQPSSLHSAFQFSSQYGGGILISPRNRAVRECFFVSLGNGEIIRPSFHKKNILNPSLLEKKMKPEIQKLQLDDPRVIFLLPDLSQKALVFTLDSFPRSPQDREQILWYRIKKQIPLLPSDVRLSYDWFFSGEKIRVLTSVARKLVIEEYENFFRKFQLRVGIVGVVSLSLLSLLKKEKNFILANIEQDSFSLLSTVDGNLVLYRQKSLPSVPLQSLNKSLDVLVQEIKNTANYLEDREKKKIPNVWIRLGWVEKEEEVFHRLKEELPFSVKRIENSIPYSMKGREKRVLSPSIGQFG